MRRGTGFLLIATAVPNTAWCATVSVCQSGCDQTTMTGAVTAAAVGDTIEVRDSRTYTGDLDLTKNVTIQVLAPSTPKIVGTVVVEPAITATIWRIGLTGGTAHCVDVKSGATVSLSALLVEGCSSSSGGGVAVTAGSTITTLNASGVVFRNNSTGNGSNKNGAHVWASGNARLTFTASEFDAATNVGDKGGAIYLDAAGQAATLRVNSTIFSGLSAPGGGGSIWSNADTIIKDSYFLSSAATSGASGGGIYLTGTQPFELTRNTFCSNTAAGTGGALYMNVSGTVSGRKLYNNVFIGNSVASGNSGGAVYLTGTGTGVSAMYNDFLSNSAPSSGQGSAYWTDQPGSTVWMAVLAYNSGGGSAIQMAGSGSYVKYSLFFTNAASDINNAAYLLSPNLLATDPVLNNYDSKAPQCGPGKGSAVWPEYLTATSPLIDAGYTDATWHDPDGSSSDIGAFGGPNASAAVWADADADGLRAIADCDDSNPTIKGPGPVYVDSDADGYGDGSKQVTACVGGGYVADASDCNDKDKAVNPGAIESCNGKDDDCDGLTDEPGATGSTAYYLDSDGDTYGDATKSTATCSPPTGYVANSTDCNDANKSVHPGAAELCSTSYDDNCDTLVNDPTATDAATWYVDADADAYGTSVTTKACVQPSGYAAVNGDCDDANKAAHPGQGELCSTAFDDNCNGQVNETTATDAATWYLDNDSDTYGLLSSSTKACVAPSKYVASSTDCNDSSAAIHPGATEICNNIDDNCNGQVDEGLASTWYQDGDKDNYGNSAVSLADCAQPTGYIAVGGDCNDASTAVHPGATETCNNVDDNCNGQTDEGLASTWYQDSDKDSYGSTSVSQTQCSAPAGYIATTGDCNDAVAAIHPGAAEVCGDGIDNNCDGIGGPPADDDKDGLIWTQESAAGASDCNVDSDGDSVPDATEWGPGATAMDTDHDGKPDIIDTDDDGDGYTTHDEVIGCASHPPADTDGIPCYLDTDDDDDSVPTLQELRADTDGDGLANAFDSDDDGDGIPTIIEFPRGDTDHDSKPDDVDVDDDGDGVWTLREIAGGTDPLNADGDNDTLLDGEEWGSNLAPRDSDGDGIPDPLDPDDDNDGIPTAEEGDGDVDCGSVSPAPDGSPNYLDLDSDGDGKLDADEGTGDLDSDHVPNFLDCADDDGGKGDSDRDGISNIDEIRLGTDPTDIDSDGDGVSDGEEIGDISAPQDTDSDGIIDALDDDDDGDGFLTADELGDDPLNDQDTDGDGILDYLDSDDDGDGAPSLDEGDGDQDADGIPNYLDANDQDGPAGDEDGDGILNVVEDALSADPTTVDTDGDGIPDGAEIGDPEHPKDSDGDGIIDVLDTDDDGDGIPTLLEGAYDQDGDGIPNYLDTDCDGDGIPDAEEIQGDPDCDGVPAILDADETDGPCAQDARTGGSETGTPTPLPNCGCRSADAFPSGMVGALLLLLVVRRRRR